jgi:hypothetical protein
MLLWGACLAVYMEASYSASEIPAIIDMYIITKVRGGPLEKWWGGGEGGAKTIAQGKQKKIRTPRKFEKKIQLGKL